VLDLSDFWHTVKLMQAALKRLPEERRKSKKKN